MSRSFPETHGTASKGLRSPFLRSQKNSLSLCVKNNNIWNKKSVVRRFGILEFRVASSRQWAACDGQVKSPAFMASSASMPSFFTFS